MFKMGCTCALEPTKVVVRRGEMLSSMMRGRWRSKKKFIETINKDLNICNLTEYIADLKWLRLMHYWNQAFRLSSKYVD